MLDTDTASVQALAARLGEVDERPEDAITAVAALRLLAAERDALRKERDEDQGVIAVWRGRTTRAEAERDALRAAAAAAAVPVAVAWYYPDGNPYTLTWQGDDEKRMAPASAEFGLVRVPLGAQPNPQPAPLEDTRS